MAARGCLRLSNLINKTSYVFGSKIESTILRPCVTQGLMKTNSFHKSSQVSSINLHPLSRISSSHGIMTDTKTNQHLANTQYTTNGLAKSIHNVTVSRPYRNSTKPYDSDSDGAVEASVSDSDSVDKEMGSFDIIGISNQIQNSLRGLGIKYLFPVQYETFQETLEGRDVVVQARTGTGKTMSFALPLAEKYKERPATRNRYPKVIVLAPTRELARQVREDFQDLCNTISVTCVYGGSPYQPQESAIRAGLDVVVGTPGRVKDMIQKGVLNLSEIEHVVLDEVDNMLDMGFAPVVDEIIGGIYKRAQGKPQTLLYSATMPEWVRQTARKYLDDDYKKVNLVGNQSVQTATTIKQLCLECNNYEHQDILPALIQKYSGPQGRTIIFCNRKMEVDRMFRSFPRGMCGCLHGDVNQQMRERTIAAFRAGKTKILLTTDVAARGIDIENVDCVIQTAPPNNIDMYIHRVGRTGRAGKSGVAICLYDNQTYQELRKCEQAAKLKFEKITRPSNPELIEATKKHLQKSISEVDEEKSSQFMETAETLIEEKGPEVALASALALLAETNRNTSQNSSQNNFSSENRYRRGGFNNDSRGGYDRYSQGGSDRYSQGGSDRNTRDSFNRNSQGRFERNNQNSYNRNSPGGFERNTGGYNAERKFPPKNDQFARKQFAFDSDSDF